MHVCCIYKPKKKGVRHSPTFPYNTAYKKVESSTKMLVQMTTGIRQFLNARFIYISFVTWFMTSWAQWTTNHNAARNSNLTHVIHDVTRMRKTQKKWWTPQKKVVEKWRPPLKRRSKRPYLTTFAENRPKNHFPTSIPCSRAPVQNMLNM